MNFCGRKKIGKNVLCLGIMSHTVNFMKYSQKIKIHNHQTPKQQQQQPKEKFSLKIHVCHKIMTIWWMSIVHGMCHSRKISMLLAPAQKKNVVT